MKFTEFKNIAMTIKAAHPAFKVFDTDQGVEIWYQMLRDLEYQMASEAVAICLKESPYPPAIADLRRIYGKITHPDWSVEWQKLLKGAKLEDLNTPAQYALQTLTEEYVSETMESGEKTVWCMKEFERLYTNYFKLTPQDKDALQTLGVWNGAPDEQIGYIAMKKTGPRLLGGGRILE